MTRYSFPASLLALLCILMNLRPTLACGGFFCQPNNPVVQSGEAIVFAVDEDANQVQMHVQILYQGPAEGFSWVLPVPTTPTLSIGTDILFATLFQETLPTFQLEVNNELSETCNLDEVTPFNCPMMSFVENVDTEADSPEATVIDKGSVGPFDYVILEAAEGKPETVFEWLETNGYDQPDGAEDLLAYYAAMGQQFVALRLQKDTEEGEIEPIVLTYEIPPGQFSDTTTTSVSRRALACVPIQLTSIAATNDMPIQAYVLGEARAVPLNYLEVTLDDTHVDWVGCFNNAGCYDDDYRTRFQSAIADISNHTFITEYAGSTEIMADKIALDVPLETLEASQRPADFLQVLANAGIPNTRRVTSIIDQYIPYTLPDTAPPFCSSFTTFYQGPSNGFGIPTAQCLWDYNPDPDKWTWDPVGLTAELDEKVFQPAQEAQDMVNSHPYLTRLYAQLSPSQMDKDPFFAFKPELPDISNVHTAEAVPQCDASLTPFALDITVAGHEDEPFTVLAELGCGGWFPTTIDEEPPITLARQFAAWGFAGDEGVVVQRNAQGGFDTQEIEAAIAFGDSLVMNQTVGDYVAATDDASSFATPSPSVSDTDSTSSSTPEPIPDDSSSSTGGNDDENVTIAILDEDPAQLNSSGTTGPDNVSATANNDTNVDANSNETEMNATGSPTTTPNNDTDTADEGNDSPHDESDSDVDADVEKQAMVEREKEDSNTPSLEGASGALAIKWHLALGAAIMIGAAMLCL